MTETPEHAALDAAVRAYVTASDPEGRYFPTGWVLCVSSAVTDDPNLASSFVPFQAGMPYHHRLGLLQMTIDDMRHFAYKDGDEE